MVLLNFVGTVKMIVLYNRAVHINSGLTMRCRPTLNTATAVLSAAELGR